MPVLTTTVYIIITLKYLLILNVLVAKKKNLYTVLASSENIKVKHLYFDTDYLDLNLTRPNITLGQGTQDLCLSFLGHKLKYKPLYLIVWLYVGLQELMSAK